MLNFLIANIEIIVLFFKISNLRLETGLNLGDLELIRVVCLFKLIFQVLYPLSKKLVLFLALSDLIVVLFDSVFLFRNINLYEKVT
jgi:hypothetical protein